MTTLSGDRVKVAIHFRSEAFRFTSFQDWVDTASAKYLCYKSLKRRELLAVDSVGRVCWKGAEFMRARDEGTFPIVVYET